MSIGAYFGDSNNVARKIKKIYVGVNDTARRVLKGYVGVNNVARLFFKDSPTITKVSNVTSLSVARFFGMARTIGDYGLIAGGCTSSSSSTASKDKVDAYNTSLVRSTPTVLTYARNRAGQVANSDYAVFLGGTSGSSGYNTIDAYNSSLVKTNPNTLSKTMGYLGGTQVGEYLIVADSDGKINTFNSSFVRSVPTTTFASGERQYVVDTINGYGIFPAIYKGGWVRNVEAINSSLVKTTLADQTASNGNAYSTTNGYYYLLAHGGVADTYDTNLVKTSVNLSQSRSYLSAASIGELCFVGGGGLTNIVETFDKNLVNTVIESLDATMSRLSATTIGKYVIFAGGSTTNSNTAGATDIVNAYEVN